MDYELRIIVEKVAVSSQEVVKRDTIKIYDIQRPESIIDLGLRHAEQISLLEKIQNAVLAEQSGLIDSGVEICPKCGQKLRKNGAQVSDFHAVFSDHTLRLQYGVSLARGLDSPSGFWHQYSSGLSEIAL
jgi:hypothetical protein